MPHTPFNLYGTNRPEYCLEFDEAMQYLIEEQMIVEYNKLNEQKEENIQNIEKQLAEVDKKLERLEERYVLEEITKDMFDKFKAKFVGEKKDIEKERAKLGNRVLNLDLYIGTVFRTIWKLAPEWTSADYNDRQELRYMVFPDGIYYNRKKDECRTPKVNVVFRYFARLARLSGEK